MNCDNASLLLYAVTDRSWLHGQTLYEQAEQALESEALIEEAFAATETVWIREL